MSRTPPLPDDALVVRGGLVIPETLVETGCQPHEDGVYGFSVQSAPDKALVELVNAGQIPHGSLGVTTVGEIRSAGFDVIPTSGKGFHATVEVPPDWSLADAARLAAMFRTVKNPSPRRRYGHH